MDVVIVAAASGASFALCVLLWHLLVHPDVVLSVWGDGDGITGSQWLDPDPRALSWLRWSLGAIVFVAGFATGAALAFIASVGA